MLWGTLHLVSGLPQFACIPKGPKRPRWVRSKGPSENICTPWSNFTSKGIWTETAFNVQQVTQRSGFHTRQASSTMAVGSLVKSQQNICHAGMPPTITTSSDGPSLSIPAVGNAETWMEPPHGAVMLNLRHFLPSSSRQVCMFCGISLFCFLCTFHSLLLVVHLHTPVGTVHSGLWIALGWKLRTWWSGMVARGQPQIIIHAFQACKWLQSTLFLVTSFWDYTGWNRVEFGTRKACHSFAHHLLHLYLRKMIDWPTISYANFTRNGSFTLVVPDVGRSRQPDCRYLRFHPRLGRIPVCSGTQERGVEIY